MNTHHFRHRPTRVTMPPRRPTRHPPLRYRARCAAATLTDRVDTIQRVLRRRRDHATARWNTHIVANERRRANGFHIYVTRAAATAVLLGLATFAMRARIDHQYRKLGLTIDDVGIGLLEPLAILGMILSMYVAAFVLIGILSHPINVAKGIGVAFVAALGFSMLTGIVGEPAASPIAIAAVVVATWLAFIRVSQHMTATPIRREAVRAGANVAAVVYLAAFISAAPATYAERADGVTVASKLFGAGLPLPDMFVVIGDEHDGRRPMVIVENGAILVGLDPCTPPPYRKQILNPGTATLELITVSDALALCP